MSSAQLPANPNSQTVAALLPKLHDADPDYRFMSLNDLFSVLTAGKPDFLHNDYNTAARTVDGILKTLDDQNGEVQNLAIKCLSPLVTKLPSSILAPLIEKLSTLDLEHSVDNSIPAMALRTVVVTLPRPVSGMTATKEVMEAYSAVSRVLIPRLVGSIVVPKSAQALKLPNPPPGMLDLTSGKEIDSDAVDVLIEVVRCFGPMLQQPEVDALQTLVAGILETEKANSVVKKRAVVAISILALFLSDEQLSGFVSRLIESLRNSHLTLVQRRLYITILGSMARSIPSRFGPYLKTLAPFVLEALSEQELTEQIENSAEDGERDPETDDVREAALVALEGFLSSCGNEMRPYTEETIAAALRFLKYDPNYDDDDDEEMGGTQDDEDDMDGFDDDDDDFEADGGFDDDDDDSSWKVRRCAAKALYTLISTRGSGDLLEDGTLYTSVAPVLVQRFHEREENVRLEIVATVSSLVRKTGEGVLVSFSADDGSDPIDNAPQSRKRRRQSSSANFDSTSGFISPPTEPVPTTGPRADLARLGTAIIKASAKLLKGNSIPTKQAIINLLDDIVSVQNGGLSEFFNQIIGPVVDEIKPTSSSVGSSTSTTSAGAASATANTLRIAALRLIGDISKTHSSSVLQPYLSKIIPGVVGAVKDRVYKVSGQAIATVEELVKALTPPRSRSTDEGHQADLARLYEVIVSRASAIDADLEVRQRSIHALGVLLARTASPEGVGLLSPSDRAAAFNLLNDRLKNETTRIAAVRAIDMVAAATAADSTMQPQWIREVSLELAAQLRKADRALRGSSLGALKSLVTMPAARSSLDKSSIEGLLGALLPLLTPSDLHLLGPTLLILAALVLDDAELVADYQLNKALCDLVAAPLGGAVLEALLTLVKNIGLQSAGQKLMAMLLKEVSVNGDPAVVGKVIGTLLVYGNSSVGVTVNDFMQEVHNPESDDAKRSLALAVLGEAGLRLGGSSPLKPSTFIDQFSSGSDKVRLAAAVALGRAGAGNVSLFLPKITATMDHGGAIQYLLLNSIKEILQQASSSPTDISAYSKSIWDHLLKASQVDENKAVGAECIGRLTIIEPKTFMPQLQAYLSDESPAIRAMVIQAIRYTLPDYSETFEPILKACLIQMLTTMLNDADLENRRLGLTTLNSATHNKPEIIIPSLGKLLPLIMRESVIKPELVREVMMGPFKHKVDDGLEVRKGAYETLYSLMETAFSRINIMNFYDRIIAGLKDEHDIRSLCNLMITKLVILDADETSRRLDAIAESYRTILSTKLKENAVKQEVEKQDEAVKIVLRVTLQLHAALPSASSSTGVPGSQHQTWRSYWEWIEKDYEPQLKALRVESKE